MTVHARVVTNVFSVSDDKLQAVFVAHVVWGENHKLLRGDVVDAISLLDAEMDSVTQVLEKISGLGIEGEKEVVLEHKTI